MILYLDTSSLVKLYIDENHSAAVKKWAEGAEIIATCRVAYPEAISAMNRRLRMGDLDRKDYELLVKALSHDWPHYSVLDFDEIAAGSLAATYGLRGFDAVHLSAAKMLKSARPGISLAFSSFDDKLNAAATSEKMNVLTPRP